MCRIQNPLFKGKQKNTFLVRYEDLASFLLDLKRAKKFEHLGSSEWGKKCPYWSSDWCKNDNILAQALYVLKSDPEKSVDLFEEAADEGSTSALLMLGQIYFAGETVPRDLRKAFKFYSRAADGGEPAGMLMSGMAYIHGYGVDKDEQKGKELVCKAVGSDYPLALVYLSTMYQSGLAVPMNRELSLYYSRRAAQTLETAGLIGHITNLARDDSSISNMNEMYEWCKIFAETGSPKGQVLLGICHQSGLGVEQNYEIANELFEKSAEQGEPQAYVQLCFANFNGRGCVINYEESARWAKKAADEGSDKGHLFVFLSEAIVEEKKGAAVSAEGVKHLEKASEMGLADAQFYYGLCFLEGLHGIKKDYEKALQLLKQAKEKGYEKASAYVPLAQAEVDKARGK